MKRLIVLACLFLLFNEVSIAQQSTIDSLIKEVSITINDTSKLIRLRTIARLYAEVNPDSSYHYAEQSLALSRKLQFKLDEGGATREMGYALLNKGNYPRALQMFLFSISLLENKRTTENVPVGKFTGDDEIFYRDVSPQLQQLSELAFAYQNLGILYANTNNNEKALHYHLVGRKEAEASGNIIIQSIVNITMNRIYLNLKKNDSALLCINRAYQQVMESGYNRYLGSVLLNTGRTYAAMGKTSLANDYYRKSLLTSAEHGYTRGVVAGNLLLADYYSKAGNNDSAFMHIRDALSSAQSMNSPDLLLRTYTSLSRFYLKVHNNDSAVKYQGLIIAINDSLFNAKQAQQFQNIDLDAQQRLQEILDAKKEYRNQLQKYSLLAGLAIFVVTASILFRNNKQKQKSNNELEKALTDLKSTQKQLIQSEKMASLGELTAGISHEIQNPLNFVINFSELSNELIAEMNADIVKGKTESIKSISAEIQQNLEKINYHGKRADAIVKGMLQHSRTSAGEKVPTDINALADEWLRLSYHGFRAKDNEFNATIKIYFDPSIKEINIIPQDIARVLLNIYNNAFYALSAEAIAKTGTGYIPTISVGTKSYGDKVEVTVSDNGSGIPPKILEKIFQPFFTTKPTGEGTGLGLSLSYDIIKAHGGELNVKSEEVLGATFIFTLPVT